MIFFAADKRLLLKVISFLFLSQTLEYILLVHIFQILLHVRPQHLTHNLLLLLPLNQDSEETTEKLPGTNLTTVVLFAFYKRMLLCLAVAM